MPTLPLSTFFFFFLGLRLNMPVMFRCIIELVVCVGVVDSDTSTAPSSAGDGGGGRLARSASSNTTGSTNG